MRTINIGTRDITDITPNEISEFLSFCGRCASLDHWNKPEISIDRLFEERGQVNFILKQYRISDNVLIESEGSIIITVKGPVTDKPKCVLNTDKWGRSEMTVTDLSWFIERNFNIPLCL